MGMTKEAAQSQLLRVQMKPPPIMTCEIIPRQAIQHSSWSKLPPAIYRSRLFPDLTGFCCCCLGIHFSIFKN